jgi:hypothetical protein
MIKFLIMARQLFIICFVLAVSFSIGKAQPARDALGRPLIIHQYVDVEGSPYLIDDWAKGVIKLKDGRTYKNMDIKYDQIEDKLLFRNPKDYATLEFVEPIKEFTLSYIADDIAYAKHFRSGYGLEKNAFYEVLADGGVEFLKQTQKSIKESHGYNSATITKSIDADVKYYLCIAGQLRPVKKDKKSIFNALSDRQPQLEAYIKANNLNLKDEVDLTRLVVYYNSI